MSFPWRTIEFLSVCFGISLIILLTVGGNLVVLFAFCNDSHLLTPSNNFLLSMAIADLLVGLICMPFYSYAQIKNTWPFGELFCKIWITIDDVVTMASVLSIVAITIERYWSINHSVHYRRHTNKTRIRVFSVLIWFIPFLNFAPGIWLLDSQDNLPRSEQINHNNQTETKFECIGAYHSHTVYLIIAQINFFAWPLVVIIVLNALIVVNLYKRSHRFPAFASFRVPDNSKYQRKSIARERSRSKIVDDEQHYAQQIDNNQQAATTVFNEVNCHTLNKTDGEQLIPNNHSKSHLLSTIKYIDADVTDDELLQPPTGPISSINESDSKYSDDIYARFRHVFLTPLAPLQPVSTERRPSKSTQTFRRSSSQRKKSREHSIIVFRNPTTTTTTTSSVQLHMNDNNNKGAGEQRTVRRLRRDKRAATSLFTLVLVFMIFLLPYVVVVVVGRIFSFEILTDTNSQIYSAAFWLLWLNSTINPILYPFIQPRFREAYRKLFLRFTRRQRHLVSLIADIQRSK